jgi:hypothetical protein
MTDENVGFFKDPSFSSIRDAERCSKVIRFIFLKFGIFKDFEEPFFERMRIVFILTFSSMSKAQVISKSLQADIHVLRVLEKRGTS